METAFKQLAVHLDNLPGGFPATDSGVELKILKRLFSAREAALAVGLTMMPEPPGAIAQRMERDEADVAPMLESMAKKGLIFRSSKGGLKLYSASQFVVGIWEYHVNSLDKDLIREVNEYLPNLMKETWIKQETKQLRVIPISKEIAAGVTVMAYEVAEEIIRQQSKIVVSDCICRKEHEMMGKGCGKPLEVCLSFGGGAYYYEENGLGRAVSQEEAIEVLNIGRDAGLVLQPGNSVKPTNICMCCGCCCQVLKNLNALDSPARAVHSNYYAMVVAEDCIACEDCVDRCQMGAITVDETAVVDLERCIGCGLCVPNCPADAMVLRQKDEAQQYVPPGNVVETYMKIAQERGRL
jgi:ferredoxin